MKAILLTALLLISSPLYAIQLRDFVAATPQASLVNTFPCTYEDVTDETFICYEIVMDDVQYRVAVDDTFEVRYIFTPKTEVYPDGLVPVEHLMIKNSI